MMHIAIYDRDPSYGLQLGDVSPGFPEEYRSQIRKISEIFGTPDNSSIPQQDALRYTPLGDKYLLSLVQRLYDSRHYNRIVHYLMDRREAEYMLQWDLQALQQWLLAEAGGSAQVQQAVLSRDGWADELKKSSPLRPQNPLCRALLTGARLSDSGDKIRIVLQADDMCSLDLLSWLLSQLPPALRIQIRFNSSISIPAEGNGCCLIFCAPEVNYLIERGISGGELANVCVFFPDTECKHSLLEREFEFIQPLLEASDTARRNALALFGEDGDWEKYAALLCIPYQSPKYELQKIAALCGSQITAEQLENLGYLPKQLESLARSAPGWLQEDPVLYRAVQKYRKAVPIAATVQSYAEPAPQPITARNAPEPEPVVSQVKRRRPASGKISPRSSIVLLLSAIVIALFAVCAKLLLGGLEISAEPVVITITAAARHYLLRSAALAVCCTALGAALMLLFQQLHRLLRRRNKSRRG